MPLGKFMKHKTIPLIIRRVRWFERFSRPRLGRVINHSFSLRFIGLLFFILALSAFLAPPFSGLDTLPAMGAVVVALSLILEDMVLLLVGSLLGSIGVGLVVGTGSLTLHLITNLVDRL